MQGGEMRKDVIMGFSGHTNIQERNPTLEKA